MFMDPVDVANSPKAVQFTRGIEARLRGEAALRKPQPGFWVNLSGSEEFRLDNSTTPALITQSIAGCLRSFTLTQCFDLPGLVPLLLPARRLIQLPVLVMLSTLPTPARFRPLGPPMSDSPT